MLVIAHRGASGTLLEHTLPAYVLAFARGADYLEPDVVLTRDGVLVCSHDLTVAETSDVAERFPGRAREDGRWYIGDLTLAELRSVSRRDLREPAMDGARYPTLEELLQLVRRLEAETGRRVGVIPEPKAPAFHADEGLPQLEALVALMARYGYRSPSDEAIIQCFDAEALLRLRGELGCRLRLVLLVSELPAIDELAAIAAQDVHGIGPSRRLIEPGDDDEAPAYELVAEARRLGLAVYPYTFGDEVDAMRRFADEHGVSGFFTDYPATGLLALGR